ncbi:hypothetical protein F4819DRAFT_509122 [Hypoxylon fuscum]|nr:hypothetical protein F4819DRAFT_509122 [Hypoxylon fuscum]
MEGRPTIRFVVSNSNLLLTDRDRHNPPQIQPTQDPGLASSPSTHIGLHAMSINPHGSDENNIERDESTMDHAKNTEEDGEHATGRDEGTTEPTDKIRRAWAAVKQLGRRLVKKPAATPQHRPIRETILVTKEVSITSEPASATNRTATWTARVYIGEHQQDDSFPRTRAEGRDTQGEGGGLLRSFSHSLSQSFSQVLSRV